jgi:hypothetical protein
MFKIIPLRSFKNSEKLFVEKLEENWRLKIKHYSRKV